MPRLQSPFLFDQVEVAYAAYCNAPHTHRAGFKKPTKKQFQKMFDERHPLEVAKAKKATTATAPTTRSNTASIDQFDPAVVAVIAKALGVDASMLASAEPELVDVGGTMYVKNADGTLTPHVEDDPEDDTIEINGVWYTHGDNGSLVPINTPTTQAATTTYKARTPRVKVPTNAARNAVLWALNTENLLGTALDLAEEQGIEYITQELGQALLADTFGPLPARSDG